MTATIDDLKLALAELHELNASPLKKTATFTHQKHRCEELFIEVFLPDGPVVPSLQPCAEPLWDDGQGNVEACYYLREDFDKHCLVCNSAIVKDRLLYTDPVPHSERIRASE